MTKKQNKKIIIANAVIAIILVIVTCTYLSKGTDGYSKQNEKLIEIQKNIILDNDSNKVLLGYLKTEINKKYQITVTYDTINNWWVLKIKSKDYMELQEFTKCLKDNGENDSYFKYINEADYAKDYANKIVITSIVLFAVYFLTLSIISYIIYLDILKEKRKNVICNQKEYN